MRDLRDVLCAVPLLTGGLILAGCWSVNYDASAGSSTTDVGTTAPMATTGMSTATSTQTPTNATLDSTSETVEFETTTVGPTTMVPTTTTETTLEPECDASNGDVDNSCPEEMPYCYHNECTNCVEDGNFCSLFQPGLDVCNTDSGRCVTCTSENDEACSEEAFVCDAATNECVSCSSHAQCDSGACDVESGNCFPEGGVWVDKLAVDCGAATGTINNPFCEVADAIASIGQNNPTIVWVRPTGTYVKPTTISNRIVALIRAPDDNGKFKLNASSVDSPLSTINGARVYIENLDVTSFYNNAPAPSIDCDNSELWIHDSNISGGQSQGVVADGCDLHILRTQIYDNYRGGLEIIGGTISVVNVFVVDNGGSVGTPTSGLSITGGASVSMLYTTVVLNQGFGDQNPDIMSCGPTANVTARNSILLGRGSADLIECDSLFVSTSVVDDSEYAGNGNKNYSYGVVPMSLSEWFENPESGDYHLASSDVFEEVGLWLDGDPATDFDGDERPVIMEMPDYPGPDIP